MKGYFVSCVILYNALYQSGEVRGVEENQPESTSHVKIFSSNEQEDCVETDGINTLHMTTLVQNYFTVAIGVSDGGLDDLVEFFENISSEIGMAFVVISNLGSGSETSLLALLQNATTMLVQEITSPVVTQPNQVYIMAPKTILTLVNGMLTPVPLDQSYAMRFPVDIFFQSLANEQKNNIIGIILSGKISDGVKGIQAIKEAQGVTFVQSIDSARYDAMPRSVIAAGEVDYILKVSDMIQELASYSNNYLISGRAIQNHKIFSSSPEELAKIYFILKRDGGVKLEGYKEPTVYRRILRRMRMHNMEKLLHYRELLEKDPEELEALQRDVLIGYTKFFRDTVFYDALLEKVFPAIVLKHSQKEPVRIWIAGCSTGEEVYSVVMSFMEYLEEKYLDIGIQVFATDVSIPSIEKARAGVYSDNICVDVSAGRLNKFFTKVSAGYKINRSIRENCLFARQNILEDPCFSRIDLVICRNVLIYFDLHAQKKALSRFYQALSIGGFVALGISESIGALSDLFSLVDKKAKIYTKKSVDNAVSLNLAFLQSTDFETDIHEFSLLDDLEKKHLEMEHKADYAILDRYGPVGILVNNELEVLQFRGHTGKYLEHMPGKASLSMMKMLRADLIFPVSLAMNQAKAMDIPVQKENIQVNYDEETRLVNVDVIPIHDSLVHQRYFVVLFSENAVLNKNEDVKHFMPESVQLQKQELAVAQEYVRSMVEECEGANRRLRTAYEGIQSSNEELQTTNEELETIKEEAQSTNEELLTINEELQIRNDQLAKVTDDMQNLFHSINMTVIMLDKELCIRRYNAGAEKIFRLIPTDIGRPLTDIKAQMDLGNFEEDMHQVMDSQIAIGKEIMDHNGCRYSFQIRPYRTAENYVDGIVVLFFDISEINTSK